jgi:hypothetical protein
MIAPPVSSTPADSFLCPVDIMLANMSATCQPNRHMSVILTLILTRQHLAIPAKDLTEVLEILKVPHQRLILLVVLFDCIIIFLINALVGRHHRCEL